MALGWYDDDPRVTVTPPRWLAWLLAGMTWLLLITYAALLLAALVLPSGEVEAWLRQVIGR